MNVCIKWHLSLVYHSTNLFIPFINIYMSKLLTHTNYNNVFSDFIQLSRNVNLSMINSSYIFHAYCPTYCTRIHIFQVYFQSINCIRCYIRHLLTHYFLYNIHLPAVHVNLLNHNANILLTIICFVSPLTAMHVYLMAQYSKINFCHLPANHPPTKLIPRMKLLSVT